MVGPWHCYGTHLCEALIKDVEVPSVSKAKRLLASNKDDWIEGAIVLNWFTPEREAPPSVL